MRLYLIRHGQSINNAIAEGVLQDKRHFDPTLTDKGQQQAEQTAQYIINSMDMPGTIAEPFGLTHVYCSPMTRALQTARPIAAAAGLAPEIWVDIHEVGGLFLENGNGSRQGFPGLTSAEIQALFPGTIIPDSVNSHGWWDVAKTTETETDYITRAVRVALALKERAATDERIALVSHGDFIDSLIKVLMNQALIPNRVFYYIHYNTGITRFDFNEGFMGRRVEGMVRLHYLNRTDHLPADLRTY